VPRSTGKETIGGTKKKKLLKFMLCYDDLSWLGNTSGKLCASPKQAAVYVVRSTSVSAYGRFIETSGGNVD